VIERENLKKMALPLLMIAGALFILISGTVADLIYDGGYYIFIMNVFFITFTSIVLAERAMEDDGGGGGVGGVDLGRAAIVMIISQIIFLDVFLYQVMLVLGKNGVLFMIALPVVFIIISWFFMFKAIKYVKEDIGVCIVEAAAPGTFIGLYTLCTTVYILAMVVRMLLRAPPSPESINWYMVAVLSGAGYVLAIIHSECPLAF
jgi:hypothetical protein